MDKMNCTIVGKAAELTLLQEIPLYGCPVKAGFPSPADDWLEGRIDLNKHYVSNAHATYFLRVSGDSMKGAGILDGDVICVDTSLEAKDKDIVIAVVNGDLTCKRLLLKGKKTYLAPENDDYPTIELDSSDELEIWGIVISCHKSLR